MFIRILTFILFFLISLLYSLRISIFLLLLSIANKNEITETFVLNNYKSSLAKRRSALLAKLTNQLREKNSLNPVKKDIQPIKKNINPVKPIDYCKYCKTQSQSKDDNITFTMNKSNYKDERKFVKNLLKV